MTYDLHYITCKELAKWIQKGEEEGDSTPLSNLEFEIDIPFFFIQDQNISLCKNSLF